MCKALLVSTAFMVLALGVAVPMLFGSFAVDSGPRLGLLILSGGVWAGLLATVERWSEGRWALHLILVGAVLLRGLALAGAPGTSDDVHRYVWEGALVLAGESPYSHSPDSQAREPQRTRWPELYAGINHPEVPAAYPPVTQAVCAVGVLAAGGLTGLDEEGGWRRATRALRLLFAVADLLVLLPLALLLKSSERAPTLLVAWAWCPLVAMESGGAAHFDAVGVLLLVSALAASVRVRWRLAPILLGAGALVKWLPLAAAPFLARDSRRFPASGALLGLAIGAGFVPVLFLAGGTQGVFGGLGEYAFRWESFSLSFRWIETPLRGWLPLDEGWNDARRVARAVVLLLLALTALALWVRRARVLQATAALLGAFVVLTPTLHPWYLIWIVPFLALRRSPAFLWLVAVAPLTYWPLGRWQREGVWVEPRWLWPVVALPFLGLLAAEAVVHRRTAGRRRPGTDATPSA